MDFLLEFVLFVFVSLFLLLQLLEDFFRKHDLIIKFDIHLEVMEIRLTFLANWASDETILVDGGMVTKLFNVVFTEVMTT